MTVTQIEPLGKNRSRVYIDEQLAFVLYRGELSRYGIREGAKLPAHVYQEILEQVLDKRAKLRCLNLLKSMDRTEQQLRQKLRQGDYPEEIIDRAIDYVKSYRYVDDEGYASRYIDYRKDSKSRQQITQELLRKGISKEMINRVYEGKEPADETAMILKWVEKKKVDLETATLQERQKLYQFLMRKGFSSRDISRVLRGAEDFS